MTFTVPKDIVRLAFVEACLAELVALKPGNVHIHAPGHKMEVSQFEASAKAAAPAVADFALGVGARVREAVEASFEAAGCNTNLGILLLCAPLAKAVDSPAEGDAKALRERVAGVLKSLDFKDADLVYEAIARANPGGLGSVNEQDVRIRPSVTLLEAMALASGRDRIARNYVTDYDDIFETGLPTLAAARTAAPTSELAVTTLHMTYLAAFEDSHIARKHGDETAAGVRGAAKALARFWRPVAKAESVQPLLDFDRDLKERGLNPGTTADFVVATLFAETLSAALSDALAAKTEGAGAS